MDTANESPSGRQGGGSRQKRRFLRNREGSTAIEFAMLAIPFAMLTFAILESCISFAGSQVLANATDNVARQLRTGQLKKAAVTQEIIRTKICEQIDVLVAAGCPGLRFDLRKVDTFKQAADLTIVYTGTGKNRELSSTNFTFTPGESMTRNTLRVFYEWPVVTDFIASSISTLKGGKTLHFASVTWQNEPFDD